MKLNILYFQLILFSCLITISISSKSKSKKKHKNKKPSKNTTLQNGLPIPETKHPSYILPELFCETCRAVINEALKELRTKTRESDVYDYLSNACVMEKYKRYEYIPQDIKRTCGIFLDAYQDEVVKLLMKRNIDMDNKDIINNFCDNYTQICKDVEVNYEKSFYKVNRNSNNEIEGMPITVAIHNENEESKKTKKNKNKNKSHSNVNNDL